MNAIFAGIKSVHYIARDPGLRWVKDPQPSIGPDTPLDSLSILTPNVIRLPAGGYRMYYTGLGPGRAVQESQGYILSALSRDGLTWHKEPSVRLDVHKPFASSRVLCPDVIPLPDGRWRMYFQAGRRTAGRRPASAPFPRTGWNGCRKGARASPMHGGPSGHPDASTSSLPTRH